VTNPTLALWWLPLVQVALGGFIGVLAAFAGSYWSGRHQRAMQRERFEREDAGMRAVVKAVVLDALQYALAAYTDSAYDLRKWKPALDRLLQITTQPDALVALGAEGAKAVPEAAFDFQLAYLLLEQIKVNPFIDLPKETPESDRAAHEIMYVTHVSETADLAYGPLLKALEVLGVDVGIDPPSEPKPLFDRVDDFQDRAGLPRRPRPQPPRTA
jgi:hypothetical protein